jgi:hypothetical protein
MSKKTTQEKKWTGLTGLSRLRKADKSGNLVASSFRILSILLILSILGFVSGS